MLDRIWLPSQRIITPNLVRGPGGGLLRAWPANTALAADTSCCCTTTARDCEYYRGAIDSSDIHEHAGSVTVDVGTVTEPGAPCGEPGIKCANALCCEQSGNKSYELLIRDYDDPGYGDLGFEHPWLWISNGAACLDEACNDNGGTPGERWYAKCLNNDLGDGVTEAWEVKYEANANILSEGSPPGPYPCTPSNVNQVRWVVKVPSSVTQRNGLWTLQKDPAFNNIFTKYWYCIMPETVTLNAPDNITP